MNNVSVIGKSCVGCGACAQGCPAGCIAMKPDGEGFLYPVVDRAACVSCGKCLSVCPVSESPIGSEPRACLAACAKDEDVLARSSSGGLFSLAARAVLASGGLVYGAALSEDAWEARIVRAEDEDGLRALCGSKYVQCQPMTVYREIDEALKAGRRALFSGCPCQTAALRRYLGSEREGLTTIDIICHGAPSPALFKAYIKWLKGRERAEITRYRFRTKARGWSMTTGYRAGDRQVYRASVFDRYGNPFQARKNYRESCYRCPFAQKARQGDVTLGDYWGVLSEHPAFYSEKGVSMLLVNTDKGERLLHEIENGMISAPSTFEQMARHNENLVRPSARPAARDSFYRGFSGEDDAAFVEKHMKPQIDPKAAVKALIPWRLKRLIQRVKGGRA